MWCANSCKILLHISRQKLLRGVLMFKSLKMYNFLRVQNLLLVDHITIQMWVLQFSNSVVWVFFNQL